MSVVTSSSDESLMCFEDQFDAIDYSPETVLDEGQPYQISNFSEKAYCPNFLKKEFATSEYSQWDTSQTNIEYSLNTDGEIFYFQKFVNSQILKNSWFALSGEPELKSEDIITFSPYPTARYTKDDDTLIFKKFGGLNNIFPGIETLYREATREEVDKFLSNKLFCTKNYNKNNLGSLNRRRIASFGERLDDIEDADSFLQELKEYRPSITVDDKGAIVIAKESDLKDILYALDERFYTTRRSSEKRLANSIVKLGK